MIPVNRATPKPGPQLSVSMRPGCGPRGVAKSTRARMLAEPALVGDALDLGHRRRAVHRLQVHEVGPVLGELLPRAAHVPLGDDRLGPLVGRRTPRASGMSHSGACRGSGWYQNITNAVDVDGRVGADARLRVRAVAVRDAHVAPVAVVLPPVVRAHEVAALDPSAEREVGAEVRAVGVHDVRRVLARRARGRGRVRGGGSAGPPDARGRRCRTRGTRRTGTRCSTGSAPARSSRSAGSRLASPSPADGVSPGKSRIFVVRAGIGHSSFPQEGARRELELVGDLSPGARPPVTRPTMFANSTALEDAHDRVAIADLAVAQREIDPAVASTIPSRRVRARPRASRRCTRASSRCRGSGLSRRAGPRAGALRPRGRPVTGRGAVRADSVVGRLADEVDEHVDEQVVLRREVEVRGRRGDAGPRRDLAHADRFVAALGRELAGGVEEAVPGGGLGRGERTGRRPRPPGSSLDPRVAASPSGSARARSRRSGSNGRAGARRRRRRPRAPRSA